ncbi:MAG: anti-sigma factor [Dermatophilaceae bacterium]
MTIHPSEDQLAGLLVDDPTVPEDVARHVLGCARCRGVVAELADVEVLLGEFGATPMPHPPAGLWESIRLASGAGPQSPARAPEPGPARAPAQVPVPSPEPVPGVWTGRRSVWTAAAAAILLVVAGAALGRFTATRGESGPTRILVQTALTTLDGGRPMGHADVVERTGVLDLVVDPGPLLAPPAGYVEVWLINTDLTRMISVGTLTPGHVTTVTIPPGALEQGYRIVDLSTEAFDDQPAHSGSSIMRGTLPA